jgi:hypothetical protein
MTETKYTHQRRFGINTSVATSSAFDGHRRDRPDVENRSFMLTTART